jgi:hypothetical protein
LAGWRVKRAAGRFPLADRKDSCYGLSAERFSMLSPTDSARPRLEAGSVVTKATLRAAERLKVSARTLAAIIGVSEATVSRMRNGGHIVVPGTKPFEIALLFIRLFRSLDAITGGDDAASAHWLIERNLALDAVPLDKARTIVGLVDVIAYLDARRAPL